MIINWLLLEVAFHPEPEIKVPLRFCICPMAVEEALSSGSLYRTAPEAALQLMLASNSNQRRFFILVVLLSG